MCCMSWCTVPTNCPRTLTSTGPRGNTNELWGYSRTAHTVAGLGETYSGPAAIDRVEDIHVGHVGVTEKPRAARLGTARLQFHR